MEAQSLVCGHRNVLGANRGTNRGTTQIHAFSLLSMRWNFPSLMEGSSCDLWKGAHAGCDCRFCRQWERCPGEGRSTSDQRLDDGRLFLKYLSLQSKYFCLHQSRTSQLTASYILLFLFTFVCGPLATEGRKAGEWPNRDRDWGAGAVEGKHLGWASHVVVLGEDSATGEPS